MRRHGSRSGTIVGRGLIGAVILLLAARAPAQPVVVEDGWTLTRTIEFENPRGAHFNPIDRRIYTCRAYTGADGLYRIEPSGFPVLVDSFDRPYCVMVDHADGDVFVSEAVDGIIFRVALGSNVSETWVSGFHSGDDDPVGMAIAPAAYGGGVIARGEALVADFGFNGLDEIWRWSPEIAEEEIALHADDGTLVDPYDVAISVDTIYVVDGGGGGDGTIYEVGAGGSLAALTLSAAIAEPIGIALDPLGGDLIVVDTGLDRVVRVDPATGAVSDMFTGFVLTSTSSQIDPAGVDLTPDGRQIVVTDFGADRIYVFSRCGDVAEPEDDCNENDVLDLCDIELGDSLDCNGNFVPDACDLANGTSGDCDENGIPDECPVCPIVEVVFVMDTSTSMNDEAAVLCTSIQAVIAQLASSGVTVTADLLGIAELPGGAYACLTDTVIDLYGTEVPGSPPPGNETLGDCPGGNEVPAEDWGRATAVVAGNRPWLEGSLRVIIPLSDEGPWCGDPVTAFDEDSIDHAIAIATANDVIVSPVTGSGSSAAVLGLADALAAGTGGEHFSSAQPSEDLALAITDLVLSACITTSDCNENGVPDTCDIDDGTSQDDDGNGIPDECETTCFGDTNGDGVVDVGDLVNVILAWGTADPATDVNADGSVDVLDLIAVITNWGPCAPAATGAPRRH